MPTPYNATLATPVSAVTSIILTTHEGANQGLGFSIAQVFSESKHPYTILIGSRNLTRGQEAVKKLAAIKTNDESVLSPIQIDVTDSSSIAAIVEKISSKYGRLDVLVNNAGTGFGPKGGADKRDDWRTIFEVNVFGVMELTHSAFPLLQKSSDPKVIVVSSNMGSISKAADGHVPIGSTGSPYAASKAAINMMVANWNHTQKDVKFWAICPGLCATNFGGDFTLQNGRDPKIGADIVRQCVEGEREDQVGKFAYEEDGKRGVYDW